MRPSVFQGDLAGLYGRKQKPCGIFLPYALSETYDGVAICGDPQGKKECPCKAEKGLDITAMLC